MDSISNTMHKALDAMHERIAIVEESCKGPVNPQKRRHEDLDSGPLEGEKRQRVNDLPGVR